MIDGRTVMEIPGEPRAAAEIEQLWAYLRQRLEGENRTLFGVDRDANVRRSGDMINLRSEAQA
jgi:hypothetical protein